MAKMTVGQAVVEVLKAHSVDTLFGIISVHNMALYDALYDVRDQLRVVGGRHEHAVGFMADGYARATGRPGVMLTSTGPGAADSMGALGESYHSSIPIMHITTNVERETLHSGRGSIHEPKDQLAMLSSTAGWTAAVGDGESVPGHLFEGFHYLATRHPRPAALEIPTDLLGQEIDVEIGSPREPSRLTADQSVVHAAIGKLLKARRPVIWAGNGVWMSGGTGELRQLAEALDCPVVSADGGKGVFPDDHPLALGSGLGGRYVFGDNPIWSFVSACDVALVVGSSLPYRSTVGVGLQFPSQLIHIDIDPEMLGRNYTPDVPIVGDARAVLAQLLEALDGRRAERDSEFKGELCDLKHRTYDSMREQFPNQLRVWEGLRRVLPRETVVVGDATFPFYAAPRFFPVYEPGTFFNPHGWVGLGYGFPAGLGAKTGRPDRPVVVVTGDGGFQYNMQELGTAVQNDIAPVVLMFNDCAWGVLRRIQARSYRGRFIGSDLYNPDFVKLAESYGIQAARVDTLDALLREMEDAVGTQRIRFIEVSIPRGIEELR